MHWTLCGERMTRAGDAWRRHVPECPACALVVATRPQGHRARLRAAGLAVLKAGRVVLMAAGALALVYAALWRSGALAALQDSAALPW